MRSSQQGGLWRSLPIWDIASTGKHNQLFALRKHQTHIARVFRYHSQSKLIGLRKLG